MPLRFLRYLTEFYESVDQLEHRGYQIQVEGPETIAHLVWVHSGYLAGGARRHRGPTDSDCRR